MSRDAFLGWARSLNPSAVDALLAASLAAVDLVALVTSPQSPGPDTQGPSFFGAGFLLLETVPLAWRRRRPVLVFILVTIGFILYQGGQFPNAPQLGLVIALYGIGAYCDRRTARRTAGVAIPLLTVFTVMGVIFTDELDAIDVVPSLVILVTVFMAGEAVRTRRAHARALEERAALLERERDEKARRAVEAERQRIARELHDVIAHNVSVMVVQAGAGRRIADERPEETVELLRSIEATGRQALGEMRRLLGVLRQEEVSEGEREPQPGMDGLARLLDQVRDAGLPVELAVEGRPRRLAPGVDLSAYRIVQEALTNALKHAGPASAQVRVCYTDDVLEIRIKDDGRGSSLESGNGRSPGQGLVGMRERVALFGGELKAGPKTGGGYEVVATLPIDLAGQ
ncbi:MAG: sensor histidine kinase [Actinomycetota bacterium]|nr:sensor histidine kinase [Actinomycetota bacterium]